ncbi:hypothetical protein K2Z83_04630 [Oscillochloris sp. ZM17-4]|uniref:hypothetical protein n=1 Tax=Oscillochloris sp. ZM17-4 TaxID=2866714 RepID=UPI001C73C1FB|nr:hypothetical protein [Oscillochloris sp. ZM17-4]MBX0326967.1 hypothetical protein [Oscillochloris sp. ZM17-4]
MLWFSAGYNLAGPTAPPLPCAVGDRIGVPVAPGTAQLYMEIGVQFVVSGANIWLNIGATAREIQAGQYTWQLASGPYTAYSLTGPAEVWICAGTAATLTPTGAPTWTPGPVDVPTAYCIPVAATATVISYAMPNLSFVIPLRASPTATITGTAMISITALIALEQTVLAGVETPAAGIATMTGTFSWSSGQQAGATALAIAQPALSWMAIVNPNNPAWSVDGGPLWALEPALLPIMPVLVALAFASFARLALWIIDWIIKLIRLVLALIELIPFI